MNNLDVDEFMARLCERTPHEEEFHHAVRDVCQDVFPFMEKNSAYRQHNLIDRLTEPDRVISFRVAWERDDGRIAVNRGYRVQYNGAIGPYKGGLRFHPSVNSSILKFLGFEQTFKNALTGLPLGGAKGGADFDPTGCSDREIRRFCQSFMTELYRYIGADTDIPAGDINVGEREIGFLFGTFKRIRNIDESAITGKGQSFGGSALRKEATGYGLIHFLCHMMAAHDSKIEDKTILISGAGNVATHAAEKAIALGGHVITLSDSRGFIHDQNGLTQQKIDWVRDHKEKSGASLEAYSEEFGADWHENKTPWSIECDIALPCATQNELDKDAANDLISNGCMAIAEGANMPCTSDAIACLMTNGVIFGPAKAANAGGVAVSGLEITQNQKRRPDTAEKIHDDLKSIMEDIHTRCAKNGERDDGIINYRKGANIAAFKKVADAMIAQGIS